MKSSPSKRSPASSKTRAKTDLRLFVQEHDRTVRVLVESASKMLLNFENEDAPPVRVAGYPSQVLTEAKLREFLERKAPYYDNDTRRLLDVFIISKDRQIYDQVCSLRQKLRKLALLAESAAVAKKFRKNMGASVTEPADEFSEDAPE